nr:MAG TPA: major capsid protein [Caudoviricetes sp.]
MTTTPSALKTGGLVLPTQVADGIWKKAVDDSVLARLAKRRPQKFGQVKQMTLTGTPRAELVGEGENKSPSEIGFGDKTVVPRKLQVTVRVTNEVQWADADYKLGVWDEIEDANAKALGRALDLIGIHKINPLTGSVATTISEGIIDCTNTVTLSGGKYDEALESATGLVLANGYAPDGIALDPMYSYSIAMMRDNDNRKLYPEMGFGQGETSFNCLRALTGTTVSGKPEIAVASKLLGIVGFWDAFRWGVQREIRAELIEYGDPDGLGDLKRKNQVAIRSEIVYGVGIMDLAAFALVKDTTTVAGGGTGQGGTQQGGGSDNG